jgi:hypothetical protein
MKINEIFFKMFEIRPKTKILNAPTARFKDKKPGFNHSSERPHLRDIHQIRYVQCSSSEYKPRPEAKYIGLYPRACHTAHNTSYA